MKKYMEGGEAPRTSASGAECYSDTKRTSERNWINEAEENYSRFLRNDYGNYAAQPIADERICGGNKFRKFQAFACDGQAVNPCTGRHAEHLYCLR